MRGAGVEREAATGVVLGILMALAIGAVEGTTADLDSTATDTPSDATETPSDVLTAVDGGIDNTERATRQRLTICGRPSWSATRRSSLGGRPHRHECGTCGRPGALPPAVTVSPPR